MPKYNYAPVSTAEDGSGTPSKARSAGPSSGMLPFSISGPDSSDELVRERLPFCLGLTVLLAIVYVLSTAAPAACGFDAASFDMGAAREAAMANNPPNIIECAVTDGAEEDCHLPRVERYAGLGQKGATLWMTGCSGAGKTTIATALEEKLVKGYGKHVYRLDGDNIRTGLNRDLGFSESDRKESVRRVGEMSTLFSDAGVITLVGLISPYRKDRDEVRKRHEEQGIPFYEIFLDVPVEELMSRDPKGLYAKVQSGELKHFTCIDDP
jgi:adenylyl-sulfate kinase